MCRVDYNDGYWQRLSESRPKSRKDRKCEDCGGLIEKGETYYRVNGVDDYGFSSSVECQRCEAAAKWLTAVCGGWVLTEVVDELREHWEEEPDLHSLGLGRLVATGRRRWTDRRGNRVSVDQIKSWVADSLAHLPAPYVARGLDR